MENRNNGETKKLTIGFVTTHLASGDGWGRYSRSLVESVAVHYHVKVLTQNGLENETTVTQLSPVLPGARFSPLTQIKTFFQILKHFRGVDVIHSLVEPYSPGVALAGHLLGIPTTMTLHGTYSVPPTNFSIKKIMMAYVYSRMKMVTTGSVYTEQKVREVVDLKKCVFIPNGVNLEKFHVIPGTVKEDMVMTVGMLKLRKGVDIVIRAVNILKGEFPNLKYTIIGDDEKEGFSEMVHALVKELDLSTRVTFLSGISDDELLQYYNRAKILVLAARNTNDGSFEGFPMIFYEANACGTPVITTKGFGSEYAIKDDKNGYVVAQDSPEEVAEKIRGILSSPRYGEMSKLSIEAATNHTWDKVALLLKEYYREVVRQ